MRIKQIDIHVANIPLTVHFTHYLNGGPFVRSVFVKVVLEDGMVGWGEAIPRSYVSGETAEGEFEDLEREGAGFVGKEFGSAEELMEALRGVIPFGVGQCALELALLDVGGQHFQKTVPELIGRKVVQTKFQYNGGLQLVDGEKAKGQLGLLKKMGFKSLKVKVGRGDDKKRLALVKKILGNDVRIGIDANNAWPDAEAAIKAIEELREFDLGFVEQPTREIAEQAKIAAAVEVPIMPDESLVTIEDARELLGAKAADMFNIRISKCGGILNSLAIHDYAVENGIPVYIGSNVGETDILTAAGRHLASVLPKIEGLEGGGEKFIFSENLVEEDLTFEQGGTASLIEGVGLGVHPIENVLKKYFIRSKMLSADQA